MIHCLIISKDRPMQLHLLLESLETNASDLFDTIRIQFIYSNQRFAAGYEKVMYGEFGSRVEWDKEEDLKTQYIAAMERAGDDFFCVLTDDSIFFRRASSYSDVAAVFNDDSVTCFSLRLGLNTIVQNYATGELQPTLKIPLSTLSSSSDEIIAWDWRSRYPVQNYGYPVSQDGHIYRAREILSLTKRSGFSGFRSWEGLLAGDLRHLIPGSKMAAFKQSCVVNIPANNVQWPPIPCGTRWPHSTEELNERYLNGEIIDFDAFDFSRVVGAHQEFPLVFRRKK